jgi:hypothetical protein
VPPPEDCDRQGGLSAEPSPAQQAFTHRPTTPAVLRSLSPTAPHVDNQALDERRMWRMLEERQSTEEPLPGHRERVNE